MEDAHDQYIRDRSSFEGRLLECRDLVKGYHEHLFASGGREPPNGLFVLAEKAHARLARFACGYSPSCTFQMLFKRPNEKYKLVESAPHNCDRALSCLVVAPFRNPTMNDLAKHPQVAREAIGDEGATKSASTTDQQRTDGEESDPLLEGDETLYIHFERQGYVMGHVPLPPKSTFRDLRKATLEWIDEDFLPANGWLFCPTGSEAAAMPVGVEGQIQVAGYLAMLDQHKGKGAIDDPIVLKVFVEPNPTSEPVAAVAGEDSMPAKQVAVVEAPLQGHAADGGNVTGKQGTSVPVDSRSRVKRLNEAADDNGRQPTKRLALAPEETWLAATGVNKSTPQGLVQELVPKRKEAAVDLASREDKDANGSFKAAAAPSAVADNWSPEDGGLLTTNEANNCSGLKNPSPTSRLSEAKASSTPPLKQMVVRVHPVHSRKPFVDAVGSVVLPPMACTFGEIRGMIDNEMDDEDVPDDWRFVVRPLGRLTLKQETKYQAQRYLVPSLGDVTLGTGTTASIASVEIIAEQEMETPPVDMRGQDKTSKCADSCVDVRDTPLVIYLFRVDTCEDDGKYMGHVLLPSSKCTFGLARQVIEEDHEGLPGDWRYCVPALERLTRKQEIKYQVLNYQSLLGAVTFGDGTTALAAKVKIMAVKKN